MCITCVCFLRVLPLTKSLWSAIWSQPPFPSDQKSLRMRSQPSLRNMAFILWAIASVLISNVSGVRQHGMDTEDTSSKWKKSSWGPCRHVVWEKDMLFECFYVSLQETLHVTQGGHQAAKCPKCLDVSRDLVGQGASQVNGIATSKTTEEIWKGSNIGLPCLKMV